MPTLSYKTQEVRDFEALVREPFDLKSPFRSTVPLLAYWADPAARLAAFGQSVGIPLAADARLTFEFTVSPTRGNGKASHTDLMIRCASVAVTVEAKYTEGEYQTVSDWLGQPVPDNRRMVLEGWLEMINTAAGSSLDIESVRDVTYQLIHRTASACKPEAERRAVVYHCFDPTEAGRSYYAEQLRAFAGLIAAPNKLPLFLYSTALDKSPEYARLQTDWSAKTPKPDVSDAVRRLLAERNVAAFGEPVVQRF